MFSTKIFILSILLLAQIPAYAIVNASLDEELSQYVATDENSDRQIATAATAIEPNSKQQKQDNAAETVNGNYWFDEY